MSEAGLKDGNESEFPTAVFHIIYMFIHTIVALYKLLPYYQSYEFNWYLKKKKKIEVSKLSFLANLQFYWKRNID